MAVQLLINFFIAFVWMFLKVSFDGATFIVGYLIGLALLFPFRRQFKDRFYMEKFWAVLKLLFLFLKELIVANIDVLKVVLKPKLDFQPGIFEYKTVLKKDWEVTLLSNLITLTPGTLVVDVMEEGENRILYIHALNVPDANEAIKGIKNSFEKAILEVGR